MSILSMFTVDYWMDKAPMSYPLTLSLRLTSMHLDSHNVQRIFREVFWVIYTLCSVGIWTQALRWRNDCIGCHYQFVTALNHGVRCLRITTVLAIVQIPRIETCDQDASW